MRLKTEIKADIKAAKKIRLPWWGLLTWMAACLPAILLFDRYGKPALALPTLNCVAVLGFVIAVKWKLIRQLWFWITMALIAALHVALILIILDHQMDSSNDDCRHRLAGYLPDTRDHRCRSEIRRRVGRAASPADRPAGRSKKVYHNIAIDSP